MLGKMKAFETDQSLKLNVTFSLIVLFEYTIDTTIKTYLRIILFKD